MQVIVSLLVSAVMLGVKISSLNAIIRLTNRKQEIEMLTKELTRARSSNIPAELIERARRATEIREPGVETVCSFDSRFPASQPGVRPPVAIA